LTITRLLFSTPSCLIEAHGWLSSINDDAGVNAGEIPHQRNAFFRRDGPEWVPDWQRSGDCR
jgi:hypothetical protein